tara:strand:+ start:75 stop:659 length:585 start_codon:yes stop_codon:yes gene_type:complete
MINLNRWKYFIYRFFLNFLCFKNINPNFAKVLVSKHNKISFFEVVKILRQKNLKICGKKIYYIVGMPRTGGNYLVQKLKSEINKDEKVDEVIDNEEHIRFKHIVNEKKFLKNIESDFQDLKKWINAYYQNQDIFILKSSGFGCNLNLLQKLWGKNLVKIILTIRHPHEIFTSWYRGLYRLETDWLLDLNKKNLE